MAETPATQSAAGFSLPLLLLMAALGFMQNLDSAIINTSLPQMAHSFSVTTINISLGVTAYMLACAAISPMANWLADRFRPRVMLLFSVLVFTFASLWCGLSGSLAMFVSARIAQGCGAALMLPIGTAIVMRHTAKAQMLRATAVQVWPALLAPVIGPVLGGFITQSVGWEWNFWLNLPLGLAGSVAIFILVPKEAPVPRRRLDITGLVFCALGLTCLLAGFQRSSMPGAERELALGLILVGLGAGWFAIRHLRRTDNPLLNLAPLTRPSMFFGALHPGMLFRALFTATPFLLPLMLQLGFGLSPAQAGFWLLVYFLGNIGIKPATTPILRAFGFRRVLLVNSVLVAVSLVICAVFTPHLPKLAMGAALLFAGATRSMQMTGMTSVLFADIATHERGGASTLMSMLQQAAAAAGVALGAFCLSLFGQAGVRGLDLYRDAFLVCAVLALAGAGFFLRMPHDLGHEVSGHRPKLSRA